MTKQSAMAGRGKSARHGTVRTLLTLVLMISGVAALAQTEVKVWTQMVAANDDDVGLAVATDPWRNVILAGTSRSILGTMVSGRYDIFAAKFDASGNRLWLVERGTDQREGAEGVATDSAGNIYLAGYTGGNLDGNTIAGTDTWDIFLMKLDPAGNWLWTKTDGQEMDDDAHAVAVDSQGNAYITGYARAGFHGLPRPGAADIFISKYDPNGNRLWSALFGSTDVDEGFGIACDSANNVYVGGYAQESVDGYPYAGSGDAVLAKYDSNGVKQWVREWGTSHADTVHCVKTDVSGNVYVAGYTTGDLYATKVGGRDLFVAKFDTDGNFLWGKQLGTSENDDAYGITTDAAGNVYVVGEAGGSLLGNPYQGGDDVFIAKFSPSGATLWSSEVGSANDDWAAGVALDSGGGIYVGGWSTGDFDGYANQGLSDAFLMKYTYPTNPPPAPTAKVATVITTSGFTANWYAANWANGYRLDVSTNSAFSNYLSGYQDLDLGNVLSRSVSGLNPGTLHYYRVRAYGTNGTSGNSSTVMVGTVVPFCTPGGLLNAGFEGGTNASGVANSWTAYTRSGTPDPAPVYKVQTAGPPPGGGLQYQQVATASSTGGAGVRQNITGCTPGATYTIAGWMRGNSLFATCTVKVSPSASSSWGTAVNLNPPATYSGPTWTPFSGTVVATGTTMTLWLDGQTTGTGNFNAECFDVITVSCPPVFQFETFERLPAGQYSMVLSNAPYPNITISESSDLLNWSVLTNLLPVNGAASFTDTSASNAVRRFYKATSP